jgi:hypothetical protein
MPSRRPEHHPLGILALLAGALAACSSEDGQRSAPIGTGGGDEGGRVFDAASDEGGDAADAGACIALDADDAAAAFDASLPPADDRLLFIGNSFTYVNDLPHTFQSMVQAWSGQTPTVNSFAPGGSTFTADLTDIQMDSGSLGALLGIGGAGQAVWTDVMLQEQSEIPGFPLDYSDRVSSMSSVVTLAGYAAAAHAIPTLIMTWGYRTGDPAFPQLFPDFLTMQGLLEAGYHDMAHAVAEAGHPVRVAPVGLAFRAIYDIDIAAGRQPTAATSLFYSLYESDAKHPAPPATYLMGLVLMSTLYGVDPGAVCANPASLPADEQGLFREAARRAVVAERAFQPYVTYDAGCGPCPVCGGTPPACCGVVPPCPP